MVKLLTFDEALKQADGGKKHALLGNGFSRACRNDLFAYHALFAQAQKSLSARAKKAFHALKTTDFEGRHAGAQAGRRSGSGLCAHQPEAGQAAGGGCR